MRIMPRAASRARGGKLMSASDAMSFIEEHGVVLASAKGPVPRLTEAIVGAPIQGSWWSHPAGRHIFQVLQAVSDSPDVLVCRLVDGKVTLVHRRLWPALARVAKRFAPERVSQVREEHTASGKHVTHEIAFPKWVPAAIMDRASAMDEVQALESLGAWSQTAA